MILELDVGNSRIKWRLVSNATVIRSGVFEGVASLPSSEDIGSVDRIRVSSVAGGGVDECISEWSSKEFGVEAEFAASTPTCAGVVNGYSDAKALGVDRWLAIVAAYKKSESAVVVVDVGSAMTIDLVSDSGEHLGGYIIPGHRLMTESLRQETGRVRFRRRTPSDSIAPGENTADAVEHGVMLAMVGAVEKVLCEADRTLYPFQLYVTGGGGELLLGMISRSAKLENDLVFEGMEWLMP